MTDGHVAILGDGTMGTTLAIAAAAGDRSCVLWCQSAATARSINERRRHDRHFTDHDVAAPLRATTDLREAVQGASLVINATTSTSFRDTARALGSLVTSDQAVFSATKGFDLPSLSRLSSVLREETAAGAVGAISGPNITNEIMAGQLSALVVASTTAESTALCARKLRLPHLPVYTNDDLVGVELSGALKNVVAIAVGIATGLDLGVNARSILITRAIAEIRHLSLELGAKPNTFFGLAGIADLYLTTTSSRSLNWQIGLGLGKGSKLANILSALAETPEGINTVRACRALAYSRNLSLPICETTCSIVEGEVDVAALEATIAGSAPYDIDRFSSA